MGSYILVTGVLLLLIPVWNDLYGIEQMIFDDETEEDIEINSRWNKILSVFISAMWFIAYILIRKNNLRKDELILLALVFIIVTVCNIVKDINEFKYEIIFIEQIKGIVARNILTSAISFPFVVIPINIVIMIFANILGKIA